MEIDLQSNLDQMDELWEQSESSQARSFAFLLPLIELIEGTFHGLDGLTQLPIAVIKIPFSLKALLMPGETSLDIHHNMPGITDAAGHVLKSAICFCNVFWAPILGSINPGELYQWHVTCRLIEDRHIEIKEKQSKPKSFPPKSHNLDCVAGMQALKHRIQEEIIKPLQHKEQYERHGISPPDGVLFYGPPGCGKTFIAKAIAGTLGWSFEEVNMGKIGSPWIHVTAGNIQIIFERAAAKAPCVLFFDEFDAIAATRHHEAGSNSGLYHNEEVDQLLHELDSCASKGIFIIAATNFYETIDPAIKRSKRISTHMEVQSPDLESREAQIKYYLDTPERKHLIEQPFNYQKVAEITEGFSAADLIAFMEEVIRKEISKHIENKDADDAMPPIPTEIFFKRFVEKLIEKAAAQDNEAEFQPYTQIYTIHQK